jgi:hypothetical protein
VYRVKTWTRPSRVTKVTSCNYNLKQRWASEHGSHSLPKNKKHPQDKINKHPTKSNPQDEMRRCKKTHGRRNELDEVAVGVGLWRPGLHRSLHCSFVWCRHLLTTLCSRHHLASDIRYHCALTSSIGGVRTWPRWQHWWLQSKCGTAALWLAGRN